MINNRRGVTLVEIILYMGIFFVALLLTVAIVNAVIKVNKNTNLSLLTMSNMTNANIYLEKALSNINNVLLIDHKDINTIPGNNLINADLQVDNKYFNQYNYTLASIKNQCKFITSNNYDLVALVSKETLDPIIIGVIEGTSETGRKYNQLAIYNYRMNKDLELIRGDFQLNHITSFIDSKGRYKSEGLTPWKCDKNNGFLIPISSKFYIDKDNIPEYSTTLESFKVLTESNFGMTVPRYGNGYLEIQLIWSKKSELQGKTLYQTYSKSFNY